MGRETKFQRKLVSDLRKLFPGCVILRNDPSYLQGVPDLLILWGRQWAALECKQSQSAPRRPNQLNYVEMMNKMSFAAFIYPENKKAILYALQFAFTPGRSTRIPQSK